MKPEGSGFRGFLVPPSASPDASGNSIVKRPFHLVGVSNGSGNMAKSNVSTKKSPAKKRTTARAKSAALKAPTDKVKRALPNNRPSKKRAAKKRIARKTSKAPTAFNPFTAMIDTQFQLAGALMRLTPLGLFLGASTRRR